MLAKTHPTKTKPKGSVQVWKYIVSATLLITEEKIGEQVEVPIPSGTLRLRIVNISID